MLHCGTNNRTKSPPTGPRPKFKTMRRAKKSKGARDDQFFASTAIAAQRGVFGSDPVDRRSGRSGGPSRVSVHGCPAYRAGYHGNAHPRVTQRPGARRRISFLPRGLGGTGGPSQVTRQPEALSGQRSPDAGSTSLDERSDAWRRGSSRLISEPLRPNLPHLRILGRG
jgi:hypothetical protein